MIVKLFFQFLYTANLYVSIISSILWCYSPIRALASRYGSLAKGSAFEDQVVNLLPQHDFWISRITKSEPSGSKAGESQLRNGAEKILPTKHLIHAVQGSFTCCKSTTQV
jgi:hypothetical protein